VRVSQVGVPVALRNSPLGPIPSDRHVSTVRLALGIPT
jgi:hypothetical protein